MDVFYKQQDLRNLCLLETLSISYRDGWSVMDGPALLSKTL